MVAKLVSLDYSTLVEAGPAAMVTLTYPGEWLSVAPNGRAAKAHLRALQLRWRRRWGAPLVGIWKLEFQRRGAPHFHILARLPVAAGTSGVGEFLSWLSITWASVVGHADAGERARHVLAGTGVDWREGLRASDPRRVAVYFLKHGMLSGKEYQNCVPLAWQEPGQGPGRFWGVWGLPSVVREVPVTYAQALRISRTVRRWHKASDAVRVTKVVRVDHSTGLLRQRTVRRRVVWMRGAFGFHAVNDAPALALVVARLL
jgi:hypothetical protein